jgi:regulator of replication initiation timing
MFQNVHDELATTKSELEEKKGVITEIIAENVHLTTENSGLMRKIEARDRLIAYKRTKLQELHNCYEEKKLHKVHNELASSQRALVSKNRAITKLQEQNQESRAELEQLRTCLSEQQLDTLQLAVATRELESKTRTITELEAKNLSLAENDSQLRRKMEDADRFVLSSKVTIEELQLSLNKQTERVKVEA